MLILGFLGSGTGQKWGHQSAARKNKEGLFNLQRGDSQEIERHGCAGYCDWRVMVYREECFRWTSISTAESGQKSGFTPANSGGDSVAMANRLGDDDYKSYEDSDMEDAACSLIA